jgi:hypothetical protein
MSDRETGDAGFPGYVWAEAMLGSWLAGMKDVAIGLNDVWDRAVNGDAYSFAQWSRDIAALYARSVRAAQRVARQPFAAADADRVVWVPLVVARGATTADSRWVSLPRAASDSVLRPTRLERLGDGGDAGGARTGVPADNVLVELNRARDRLRVRLVGLGRLGAIAGAHVGFVTEPGVTGQPLATVFVSFEGGANGAPNDKPISSRRRRPRGAAKRK